MIDAINVQVDSDRPIPCLDTIAREWCGESWAASYYMGRYSSSFKFRLERDANGFIQQISREGVTAEIVPPQSLKDLLNELGLPGDSIVQRLDEFLE